MLKKPLRRPLTSYERQGLEEDVDRWLKECQRWIDVFEVQASKFTDEWLKMEERDPNVLPPTRDLIITATYFIMTAGCVWLRCESIVEAKNSYVKEPWKVANEWVRNWVSTRGAGETVLNALERHRNWANHGAVYVHPDYKPVLLVAQDFDKTLPELVAEAKLKGQTSLGVVVRFYWTDEDNMGLVNYLHPERDISQWQKDVVNELSEMIEAVKRIP